MQQMLANASPGTAEGWSPGHAPCLTVSLPCTGGAAKRMVGGGPAVQFFRMEANTPTLTSASGVPVNCRLIVRAAPQPLVRRPAKARLRA